MKKLDTISSIIIAAIILVPAVVAAYIVALPMGIAMTCTIILGGIARSTT